MQIASKTPGTYLTAGLIGLGFGLLLGKMFAARIESSYLEFEFTDDMTDEEMEDVLSQISKINADYLKESADPVRPEDKTIATSDILDKPDIGELYHPDQNEGITDDGDLIARYEDVDFSVGDVDSEPQRFVVVNYDEWKEYAVSWQVREMVAYSDDVLVDIHANNGAGSIVIDEDEVLGEGWESTFDWFDPVDTILLLDQEDKVAIKVLESEAEFHNPGKPEKDTNDEEPEDYDFRHLAQRWKKP